MATVGDVEPFRYDAEAVNPSTQAMEDYYGSRNPDQGFLAGVPTPIPTSSINNQKIEDFLNRIREALVTDLTAIEARLTALETP